MKLINYDVFVGEKESGEDVQPARLPIVFSSQNKKRA
jgi:hypothetical protein